MFAGRLIPVSVVDPVNRVDKHIGREREVDICFSVFGQNELKVVIDYTKSEKLHPEAWKLNSVAQIQDDQFYWAKNKVEFIVDILHVRYDHGNGETQMNICVLPYLLKLTNGPQLNFALKCYEHHRLLQRAECSEYGQQETEWAEIDVET